MSSVYRVALRSPIIALRYFECRVPGRILTPNCNIISDAISRRDDDKLGLIENGHETPFVHDRIVVISKRSETKSRSNKVWKRNRNNKSMIEHGRPRDEGRGITVRGLNQRSSYWMFPRITRKMVHTV
jgi:hypothetical protein